MLNRATDIPAHTLAARVHQFGGPENILLEEIPTPLLTAPRCLFK